MKTTYTLPHNIFTGEIVRAAYREQAIASFRSNPLLEVFPPLLTRQEAAKRLSNELDYKVEQRCLPIPLRLYLIQEIVNYFEPLPVHIDLERRFAGMIRMGLTARNPLARHYWHEIDEGEDGLKLQDSQNWQRRRTRSAAVGFGIVGDSGVGKTCAVEEILSLYPQVIIHDTYNGQPFSFIQLVWVKLECPHDGSIKSLCLSFFETIDSILGTNYCRAFARNGRATVEQMRPKIARVAGLHGIGVLVIDEIQQLNQAKSGGADRMLNFFVGLVNVIGLPVVLIGTDEALPILAGTFRNARRLTGQGDLHWERMKPDAVWDYFVEGLWKYQYTREVTPLSTELSEALYYETQGIIDLAVKVFMLAQVRAITVGEMMPADEDLAQERITSDILHSVAQDSLKSLQPMLCDFREGKLVSHRIPYTSIDVKHYINEALKSLASSPDALQILQAARAEPPGQIQPTPAPAKADAKSPKRQHRSATSRPDAVVIQGGLLEVHMSACEQKMTGYEALRQAGHIRSGAEFLEGETPT